MHRWLDARREASVRIETCLQHLTWSNWEAGESCARYSAAKGTLKLLSHTHKAHTALDNVVTLSLMGL